MTRSSDPILRVDFAGMYRRQWDRSSFGPRRASDWDNRAAERYRGLAIGDYERQFLAHMDLREVDSVLDIGCGTGNLAVPLARRVRRVYALDFSPRMLEFLKRHARRAGVRNIRAFCLSWTDSWRAVPQADVALCSRAMGVRDLKAALRKMSAHARLRCYATLHVRGNYLSDDVARALRRVLVPRPSYIYAVNILYQMGFPASVAFIRSSGGRSFASFDEFRANVEWRVGRLSAAEVRRLEELYRALPVGADGRRYHAHDFEWALLSWETKR